MFSFNFSHKSKIRETFYLISFLDEDEKLKSSFCLTDAPFELPIAVSSKQVRDVLKSELSTSVPVTAPVIAVRTPGTHVGLLHSKEADRNLRRPAEAVQAQEVPQTGN